MPGKIALYSRLLSVSLRVCAAVMSFIMCSDAARACPTTTRATEVKHNILRSLFTPHSQHHALSPGLPSTETGLQTGTNSETEMNRNSRAALSIIDHQPDTSWFTESGFGYSQNSPDCRPSRAGIIRAQRGRSAGGVRPESSTITSHLQHEGQSFERSQSRLNYPPLSQKVARTGNSYTRNPLIIRKSAQTEAGSPLHRSSGFSQVWEPEDAQTSYTRGKFPRNESPKMATDKTVWPLQTGDYWSTSPPTPRGHYRGYKETNEPAAVRVQSTSTGIQSSEFRGFASQTAPNAPSIRNGLVASVIKPMPSPEKLTSSLTDFSQGLNSVTSSETLRHKGVRSYLFKDSQTSFETVNAVTGGGHEALSGPSSFTTTSHKQRPSDAQVYARFASNFKQLNRQDKTKEDNTNPVTFNTSVAQYGDSFTKYQLISSTYPSAQLSSGKAGTIESFVSIPHAASQDNSATSREKSVSTGSPVNTTTRGSLHGFKTGRSTKSLYGIRGFKSPLRPTIPPSSERTNSQQYSLDKGKDYEFKIANTYPSLLSKYSFGRRGASVTTTTPANLKRTPTDYSPPSSGSLDLIQTTTVSAPRPFTSGFKDVRPLLPEGDAGNPDHRQVRIYKRTFGLKGFGPRPLEGAKALVREPGKSTALQQSFKGFELRGSQIWQLKGNTSQTGETQPKTSNRSTQRRNELSSEDFKPLLKTAGRTESVERSRFTPDKYKKNRKIFTFLGFQSLQNRTGSHWKYAGQNPTTAPPAHRVSSAYLRSAGGLKFESSPTSEPRTPNKAKPAAVRAGLLHASTSSTVRGIRVKGKHINSKELNESTSLDGDTVNAAIVRLPTHPARVKAVTYADILGSASFSSVRATTQSQITPADRDYVPNTTPVTEQKGGMGYRTLNSDDRTHSGGNTSRADANAEDEVEDFSHGEEEEPGFKSGESDGGTRAFDALLDDEGSGSGVFNLTDVLSTGATESQGFSEDLLELDYLRISTGNVSFKSVKLSHAEK